MELVCGVAAFLVVALPGVVILVIVLTDKGDGKPRKASRAEMVLLVLQLVAIAVLYWWCNGHGRQ